MTKILMATIDHWLFPTYLILAKAGNCFDFTRQTRLDFYVQE